MSVQSEIDRIAGAKSDISTAITNKGVTVPDGTKLDGMAALIDSIESGGGSSFNVYETVVVTFNVNYGGENGIGYYGKNGATFSGILQKGTYTFEILKCSGVCITGHGNGTVAYVSVGKNSFYKSDTKTDVDFARELFNIPTDISIKDYKIVFPSLDITFNN